MMRNAAGTKYYYHVNHLYSVHAITNQSGAIVEAVDSYDAYGKPTIITGAGTDATWFTGDDVTGSVSAIGNPFWFQGHRVDSETGLGQWRLRYYDYEQGRFLNRNPWGYIQDRLSLYDFERSCPSRYLEPMSYITESVPKDSKEIKKKFVGKYGTFRFFGWSYGGLGENEYFTAKFEPSSECDCPESKRFWVSKYKDMHIESDGKVDKIIGPKSDDWTIDNGYNPDPKDPRYAIEKAGGGGAILRGNIFKDLPFTDVRNQKLVGVLKKTSTYFILYEFQTCLVCWDSEKGKVKMELGCFEWTMLETVKFVDGAWTTSTMWPQYDVKPGTGVTEQPNPGGYIGVNPSK